MQRKSKIEEFKVSIRNKNLSQKLAHLRAKQQTAIQGLFNIQQVISKIQTLFANSNITTLYQSMLQIKKYTNVPQILKVLKQYFQGLYRLLIQVDNHFPGKLQTSNSLYKEICTILINITSSQSIDLKEQIKSDIATPVFKNITNKNRQTDTLWFISNLLFRKNKMSQHFMDILIQKNVQEYIRTRTNLVFQTQTDTIIFYYFVGAVTASLQFIEGHAPYLSILKVIEKQAETETEQYYLYILDGLAANASAYNKHKYQIFGTGLLKKCDTYCKNKKTRFVIKYLELIINFLRGEENVILDLAEQNKKKVLSQQYERLKNNNIIKNLQFCLQNRSPEVKGLLFETAAYLLGIYFKEIDLASEYLYLTLAQQISNAQKFDEKGSYKLLKYLQTLIILLLKQGNLVKNDEYVKIFLKFLQSNLLFQKIEYLLASFSNSGDILNVCFDILAYLQDYNIGELVGMLRRVRIEQILQSLIIESPQLDRKRNILLSYITNKTQKQLNTL